MLEIRYENRIGDLIYSFLKSFFTRKTTFLVLSGFFVTLLVVAFDPLPDSTVEFLAAIIAALLVFSVCVGLVLGIVILNTWMKHRGGNDKGFLTEHRITFSKAGYVEETAVNRTESKWEGVFALKKDSQFIFVYESPERMHLIPRRAFQSEIEFNDFFCGIKSLKAGGNAKAVSRSLDHAPPVPASHS